jgi:hypothetical protein
VPPSTRERSRAIDAGACLGAPGPEFLKEGVSVRGPVAWLAYWDSEVARRIHESVTYLAVGAGL